MERERSSAGRTILIAIGVLLVLFGIWALIGQTGLIPRWLIDNWGKLRDGFSLVILGAFVIWLATGGAIKAPASGTRLYRSRDDKWLAGVLGGLGEYLRIDPVILRVVFIAAVALGFGWVIVAYILMAIFVPVEPQHAAHTGVAPWPDANPAPPVAPVAPVSPAPAVAPAPPVAPPAPERPAEGGWPETAATRAPEVSSPPAPDASAAHVEPSPIPPAPEPPAESAPPVAPPEPPASDETGEHS